MATLTIRDLDESLKRNLRIRAAKRNRSMEEEARQILRAALLDELTPALDLASRVRARFAAMGDVQLPIAQREPVRPAHGVDDVQAKPQAASKLRSAGQRKA
jgi:antitoxin FitA